MTELIEVENNPVAPIGGLSPLVQAAMSGGLDTEKLAQLLDIQKAYEKNEAEKAFHQALANFKSHEITIEKDKLVSFKTSDGKEKSYRHATLGASLQTIAPLLSEYGLSLSWETNQDMEHGGMITVTCVLSHAMGYSKETSLTASPDASGKKNPIQSIGSTVTYLQRYTGFSLLGIASMDQDDDGAGSEDAELITEEQVDTIQARIDEHQITAKFMKWLSGPPIKCGSVEEIQAGSFDLVQKRIDSAIRAQEKK